MLGYPIAFLAKLYDATKNSYYIDTAKAYMEILLGCQGNLRTFHYSHKVAWGSAMMARITKDERYADELSNFAKTLVKESLKDTFKGFQFLFDLLLGRKVNISLNDHGFGACM